MRICCIGCIVLYIRVLRFYTGLFLREKKASERMKENIRREGRKKALPWNKNKNDLTYASNFYFILLPNTLTGPFMFYPILYERV